MPDKMKIPTKRAPKVSGGKHGGGGKVKLDDVQKVLLVSGGMAHHTRKGKVRRDVLLNPTRRQQRHIAAQERQTQEVQAAKARQRAEKDHKDKQTKQRQKEQDARAKAAAAVHSAG